MTKAEHIEYAEALLDGAKDVAKRPKDSDPDRKRDQVIVMELLDFSRTHAAIAGAL